MNSFGVETRRPVTIAVTSGKGGVGKTNVVVNLAVSLARLRQRVAIVDADFGLGNVDVLLGLAPASHLGHVLTGEKTMAEIAVTGPHGVQVIPASSGVRALTALTPEQWTRLREALDDIAPSFDFVIIDTAAGVSDNVMEMLAVADRVLVVTALEPTAVVDAYALIKLLTAANPSREIGLLVNNARDANEAELVFAQLDCAVERFLQRRLHYYGFIPHDPAVREAILVQRPLVDHLPQSLAGRNFRILASRLSGAMPGDERRLRLVTRPGPATSGAPRCA